MSASDTIALARMLAQRIHGDLAPSPVDAVRWMCAMQAQDLPGAKWSVGLRTVDGSVASVDRALNAGQIVRAWPMRGTLHLVAAEDLGWMLSLTAERMTAGARSRYAQLGLDEDVLATARGIAERELEGGRSASRRDLLAAFDRGGVASRGRGSHLIGHLAITGVVCLGPVDHPGDEETAPTGATGQRIVLAQEWIRDARRPDRDAALAEWLTRYVASHGPATVRDFVHWTKLTAKDAGIALELAGDAVVRVPVDGAEQLCSPATAELLATVAQDLQDVQDSVDLLPGFDELVLGYRDRSASLPERHSDRIVPGGNGMFLPTIVRGGRVVGTWRRTVRQRAVSVEPDVFPGERMPPRSALLAAARRYAAFLGKELAVATRGAP